MDDLSLLNGFEFVNHQIAQELALNKDDTQQMTTQLRSGIMDNKPEVILHEAVEVDEAYVVAGFKGQPLKVAQKGRKGRRRRLKGKPGRGTLEKERPPIFGMVQRGGQVVIKMQGKCSTSHHQTNNPTDNCSWHSSLYR